MSKKSEHSQSSFIPEGMEYREEYMLDALTLYQNQKAKLRRRRTFYGLAALAILASSLLYVVSDRNAQNKASDNSQKVNEQSIVKPIDPTQNSNQSNSTSTQKNAVDSKASSPELIESPKPGQDIPSQDSHNSAHQNAEKKIENSKLTPSENQKRDKDSQRVKNILNNTSSSASDMDLRPTDEVTLKHGDKTKKEQGSDKKQHIENNAAVVDLDIPATENSEDNSTKSGQADFQLSKENKIEENVSIIPLLGFSLFDNGDEKLATANPMKVEYVAPARKDSYYLSAGANVLSQFATDKKDFNFDPSFALGWTHRLNKNFSLGLESGYFSIAKINRPFETTSVKYGESFTATTTTILTDKLHYLNFGPRLYFNRGLHQFELGYSLSYLLTGNNRIEVFSMSDSYTSPTAATKTSGYVQGFTDFSHDISLGYNYKIGKYACLGFAYHFGLTDISKNQYFTTSGKDFNSRLELHFKVNIR